MHVHSVFLSRVFFLIEQMRYFDDCGEPGEGWLSFGLNVASQIMKTLISAVIFRAEKVEKAYLDNIYIN